MSLLKAFKGPDGIFNTAEIFSFTCWLFFIVVFVSGIAKWWLDNPNHLDSVTLLILLGSFVLGNKGLDKLKDITSKLPKKS